MEMISGHFTFLAFGLISTLGVGSQTHSREWREFSALIPPYTYALFFRKQDCHLVGLNTDKRERNMMDCTISAPKVLKFVCIRRPAEMAPKI